MTPCDCLDKVSVQFLSTDANRKGGTLDKSLFMLDLVQTTVVSHTYGSILFLSSFTGIINRLLWKNVSLNLGLLAQV